MYMIAVLYVFKGKRLGWIQEIFKS